MTISSFVIVLLITLRSRSLPVSGANVITTDNSDWATNCPEFKVTAVQVTKVTQPSSWQSKYQKFSEKQIDFVKDSEEKVS